MSWAAVAAGAAGLIGGAMSSSSAKSATGAQIGASQAAIDQQRQQFLAAQQSNAPFLATGTAANQRLATLLGISTPTDYQGNPQQWADAWHQQVDPTGRYVDQSDPNYQSYVNNTVKTLQAQGVGAANTSDPAFGSLTRNFNSADLAADPVYNSGLKFGLDQGTAAVNARAIAGGGYDSGGTLKALTQYANDYGNTKANDAFNRFQTQNSNTYNRLAGVSGGGQTAVGQVNAAGANSANNVSNLLTGMGNATAAGIVGGANAWGSGAQSVASAANNYQSNQTLQALLRGTQGAGGGTYQANWDNMANNYGL